MRLGEVRMEWLDEKVLWLFNNARVMYAFMVVGVMALLGTVIGLSVDFFVKAIGIKLEKYTDNHTG